MNTMYPSGFFSPYPGVVDGGVADQISIGALETDGGALVDHIQFTYALARRDADGGQSPVAYIPLHSEYFDLTEVIP